MRITYTLLFLLSLLLIGCNEDKVDVLHQVAERLDKIETVKYTSVYTEEEEGVPLSKDTATVYFDFREPLKYYLSSDFATLVHNDQESITLDHGENTMVVSKPSELDPSLPLAYTLYSLQKVLPQLLARESDYLLDVSNVTIEGKQCIAFTFSFGEEYVDWQTQKISNVDSTCFYSVFSLIISEDDGFPLEMTARYPQREHYAVTVRIEDVDFDFEETDDVWDKSKYAGNYVEYSLYEHVALQQSRLNLNIGSTIEEFELPNLFDDHIINTSELTSKITILEFWFKGCGACLQIIPDLNALYEKYRGLDIEVYGIEFFEAFPVDHLRSYVAQHEKSYPDLYQGKRMASRYGVAGAPTIMILDENGRIIYLKTGFYEREITEIIAYHI
ncbi:MAG: TlpA disulfide reductase family protein [Bacteroidota bacterium]